MSRRIFTEEQQQLLRQNPYIYSVTDTRINLTKESRRYFWQNINLSPKNPVTVLTLVSSENAAYGASPITSIPNIKVRRISRRLQGQFHHDTGSKNNSDADKIKQLQQEVDYLKQEMEFLKKFPQSELQKPDCS